MRLNLFRPYRGFSILSIARPTAYAVGYNLSPLTGLRNTASAYIEPTLIYGFFAGGCSSSAKSPSSMIFTSLPKRW